MRLLAVFLYINNDVIITSFSTSPLYLFLTAEVLVGCSESQRNIVTTLGMEEVGGWEGGRLGGWEGWRGKEAKRTLSPVIHSSIWTILCKCASQLVR